MLRRVLFAGGGTGGHIFMAVALAEELRTRRPGVKVLFVGASRGIDKTILEALGFPLATIDIGGLKGVGLRRKLTTLLQVIPSMLSSRRIIKAFDPSIIVGLGGYSSGPVMLTGKGLGLPLLLIEPNVLPGFTNRTLAPWVRGAAVAFPETAPWFGNKARVTGIPVREEFQGIDPEIPAQGPLRLLVLGGSQGSGPINRLMCLALPHLVPGQVEIVHQTGIHDFFAVKESYAAFSGQAEVLDFIHQMAEYFERADLILSRAGALTVAEITHAGRASILIPLPQAADDHQRHNAGVLARQEAALALEQRSVTGEELARLINQLATDRPRLQAMGKAARGLARGESRTRILEFMEELSAG